MAKEKKPRRKPPAPASESQAAEALTVAWALAVVTVFLCDVGAVLTRLYALSVPEAAMMELLSGLLFFAAAVIGLIVLILVPIVYRIRNVPPPRGFTAFAMVVAAFPLAMMLVALARP